LVVLSGKTRVVLDPSLKHGSRQAKKTNVLDIDSPVTVSMGSEDGVADSNGI
jgi:hypothetical protein